MPGFVEDDGQIPRLLATRGAGRVGHQDLSVLHAVKDNEVAGSGEMPFRHERHHQLPAAERVQYTLGFGGSASLHGQAPCLGCVGNDKDIAPKQPEAPTAPTPGAAPETPGAPNTQPPIPASPDAPAAPDVPPAPDTPPAADTPPWEEPEKGPAPEQGAAQPAPGAAAPAKEDDPFKGGQERPEVTKVILTGDRLRKYFPDVSMTPREIEESVYSALEERRQRQLREQQKAGIFKKGGKPPR